MGEGALRCSLYLSPRVLPDSPMYCSVEVDARAFISVNDTTFGYLRVLVLGDHE